MDIYDFKSFQEKVARFSVSPYAEAITTLAGLSPQVVSIANRLASAYASLRGTVQLLTTDEDNKIIDDTTEARETIARSAIVSAWNSMGSAVERLVSLRRNLSGDGVTKSFARTPVNYTSGESYAGYLFPCIIPGGANLHEDGWSILMPDGWADYAPIGPGKRFAVLPIVAKNPLVNKVVGANPTPGELFQYGIQETIGIGPVTIGSNDKPLVMVGEFGTSSLTPELKTIYYLTAHYADSKVTYSWKKLSSAPAFQHYSRGYYMATKDSFPTSAATASDINTMIQFVGMTSNASPSVWCLEKKQVYFPAASDQVETFDPLDPYEVFTQAYQAADAVLSLMEDMGYSSGLSQEDRALLSSD